MRLTLLLLLSTFFLTIKCDVVRFRVIRQWKYVNFTWPSDEIYTKAISNGEYIPENIVIGGIKYFDNNYYITLPRMRNGVPITLSRISTINSLTYSPPLEPYPNWEQNRIGDCTALQNVQNVEIDSKGLLWIIDGGRIETLNQKPLAKCPPKLIVHDLRLNKTITTYQFPEDVASFNGSFLYDIVVDDSNDGYAYITDNSGKDPGIIVFSIKENRSWKIRHSQSMRADPQASHFHVGSVDVAAPLNLASIALGPKLKHFTSRDNNDDKIELSDVREVFYCPISSLHLYSLNTTVLRNEQFAHTEYQGDVKDYGIKASQTVGMIMDNDGNLYYSLLATNSIAKWNIHTSFQSGQKVIAHDEKFLEWPNSYTFTENGNLTVLVNRLDRFILGELQLNEYNFWLIEAPVGGKSYVYDDDYKYNVNETQYNHPELPIGGSDQDPYLMPILPPEPKSEPEPTPNHFETTTTTVRTTTSYRRVSAHSSSAKLTSFNIFYYITVVCLLLGLRN